MHAYFDCFAGISGDMTLGALIDLGLDPDWLAAELRRLPLDGFRLVRETVHRSGIRATRIEVAAEEGHHHRDWSAIRQMIGDSPYSPAVRRKSLGVFERIARAEAAIHGVDLDRVHFHEVGGIDALVDIVGGCLGLEKLGITAVSASALPQGRGLVRCAHGTLPVPAPATLAILEGLPVYGVPVQAELVTPTGAALMAGLAEDFGPLPAMRVARVGYGAGQQELADRPNLLRIVLGQATDPGGAALDEVVAVVETTIDDMNPEIFGYLMERLFADGALDVCWLPVQMKKNRPGIQVQVVCRPAARETVIGRILTETTSLGVRHATVQRRALDRRIETCHSPLGPVQVKRITGPDGRRRRVPEYEACRRIAREHDMPLRAVYDRLQAYLASDPEPDRGPDAGEQGSTTAEGDL